MGIAKTKLPSVADCGAGGSIGGVQASRCKRCIGMWADGLAVSGKHALSMDVVDSSPCNVRPCFMIVVLGSVTVSGVDSWV